MFIFFTAASLESARKSAADSNYETTDEERLGRGKRQHISNSRFKSDEEEYDYHQSQKYIKSKVLLLLHIFFMAVFILDALYRKHFIFISI